MGIKRCWLDLNLLRCNWSHCCPRRLCVTTEFVQNVRRVGWVDLGVFGKKCFDFFGLQETVSRNSYMTTGLYRYSLAQPAILPPAQHMRGTSKIGSFNLSISKIIFDK